MSGPEATRTTTASLDAWSYERYLSLVDHSLNPKMTMGCLDPSGRRRSFLMTGYMEGFG